MATLSEDESTRMYSWWWDSHISPKNSKWLQENLTDMDVKVKAMIKVIEEDADSFAQRAEMYYKKRPELLKLVEEFYRAYRALAERYDNATCVIRQAHQTMAEAFPNQVPLVLTDDSLPSSASDTDPHTPDTSIPIYAMIDHDDYATSRKGMKELNDLFGCGDNVKFREGKVRKGLNFDDVEGKEVEKEIRILKEALDKLEAEKEDGIIQYHQSLERLSNLEREISSSQEDSRRLEERASKAEAEVEDLKQSLAKFTEEAERVNGERDNGVAKLKEAEERCVTLEKSNQSLQSELESMELKMGNQNEELTEKNKELGRVWTCLQEERLRFAEAETAFQALQNLHSQAQEELRHLDLEIKNRTQIFFREMENRYKSLKDEVSKVEEENKNLKGLNLASSISMKDMQDEIFRLTEIKGKLEVEVELRVDQRNSLQQELYCLKEELNELHNENSNLKGTCERERNEKEALLEKLEIMGGLMEKNTRLENSISDLSDELEGLRGKVKALEESSQSLLEEKSTLVGENATLMTQLHATTKNLEKLSENNTFLENSLSDAHDELEVMKEKSKSLEDSYRLLDDEKSGLISQKDMHFSQLNFTRQKLEELEKSCKEIEEKNSCLEREKKSALRRVEDLQVYLDAEKNEHALFTELSETQIRVLQEEDWLRKREYEEELNKDMDSQIEIFVLQRCVQDLEENNLSLLGECQKLLEESKYSEKLISELRSKVRERDQKEEILTIQVENLQGKLLDFQRVYKNSQEQNSKVVEGKRSMMNEFLELEEKTCTLEKENGAFEEKLRTTERKFEAVEMENFHLKERLWKSEEKLKAVETVCYQLSYEFANGKDLLLRKEMELSEVEKKLVVTENKKLELQTKVEDLKRERDDVEMIRQNQERQIVELSEENCNFSEENGWLCEEKRKLEVELNQLWEENEGRKHREESLCSELQKRKNENDQWETEDQNRYTGMDIELLKQKVSTLEGENGGLKAHLAAYFPTIVSLRDCISSLENQLCSRSELRKIGHEGTKDAVLARSPVESFSSEDENITAPNAFSDLQDLQAKVKDIENAVFEMEKNLDVNAKLDAAMRQIEELKSKSSSLNFNPASEISEKHIMLDQISDCSYHVENDSQIFELWETADQNGSIDLTVKKKDNKNSPSSEVLVQKELAVDKSEISKIPTKTRQEDNKRKVLERLNSDAQKLTNLRITVQDLKTKVENTEKTKNGKSTVECDSVKGQLEEFEEGIQKLFDHNGKLTKNYEKLATETGESGSFRRKRVSEQARRVSEKIGRIQLEVQKIQFFLLKLDDEKERNGKTRIAETKRRVLLRDYLYGGVVRTSYRRKKAPCCGCVQLPTKG